MKSIYLALWFILFFGVGAREESKAPDGCLVADIIFIADWSGSIKGNEGFVVDAIETAIGELRLSERLVKVGVISFSDVAFLRSSLTTDRMRLADSLATLSKFSANGSTNYGPAFFLARRAFSPIDSIGLGRKGVQKIIVFISDGLPSDFGTAIEPINAMKILDGVKVVCVNPSSEESSKAILLEIATDESLYFEVEYESLVELFKKLDICG